MKNVVDADKVLVLDFDHTCYDTDAFLMLEIREVMLNKFNIPSEAWEESYESVVKTGYSLENHFMELTKILPEHASFPIERIKDFEKEINFGKYLYPDTMTMLNKAKEKGYKLMLVSFGAPGWQDKKVAGVGLDKVMDVIKYTKEEGNKVEVLKKYTKGCNKVIFIENNGQDLDAVYEALPYVERYLINRVPYEAMNEEYDNFMKIRYGESRRMAKKQVIFAHKQCHSLEEVIL